MQDAGKTPTQLQGMGVDPYLGTAMLSRGWMSWADRETKAFLLRAAWVLTISKAIPRPGQPAHRTDAASQAQMGLFLGLDRSTINRLLRKFCGEDAQILYLFNKRRPGIGVVNRYSERRVPCECVNKREGEPDPNCKRCRGTGSLPDPHPGKQDVLLQCDPAELAERYGAAYFDAAAEHLSGTGRVRLWTYAEEILEPHRCECRLGQMKFNFSSRCLKCGGKGHTFDGSKMGPNPRTVLTALQLKGLGGTRPFLEMTCAEIGKLCGLCENTIAHCLDQWEDLKVLQIVPGRVVYEPGTKAVKFRYPQRIIWLPGLLLDRDVVENERRRFNEAAQTVFLTFGLTPSLQIAKQRHAELLAMWHLSRHSVGSLWSYLRAWLLLKEGCEKKEVDLLFPLHRAWNDS